MEGLTYENASLEDKLIMCFITAFKQRPNPADEKQRTPAEIITFHKNEWVRFMFDLNFVVPEEGYPHLDIKNMHIMPRIKK